MWKTCFDIKSVTNCFFGYYHCYYLAYKENTIVKSGRMPILQAGYHLNLQSSPHMAYIGFNWIPKTNFHIK